MRNLLLRAAAIAALTASPTFVWAQGGPGGPGPDRGPGAADHGPAHGDRGERGGPREDRHADQGPRGGERDRGPGRDRPDRDRGPDRERVQVDERDRGRDDRVRGDRDNVRVDERVTRDRRDVDRRVDERVGRPGPRQVTIEERGRFRERIGRLGGERIHGGDFAVRVGGRLPDRYRFERLPPELVEVVPEYRNYDYVRVDERILILDPETREIVDVIED